MQTIDTAKPATACGEPASDIEHLGGRLEHNNTPTSLALQLRANLIGNDLVIVGDIKACGALDLCRRLLAAGADPAAELLCYRDRRLALRIRSIGEGARLTIRETANDGPRFTTWRPFPAARSERPFVRTPGPYIHDPHGANALGDGA